MPADDCSVDYRPVPGFPAYRVGDDGTLWSRFALPQGSVKGRRPLRETWGKIEMAPKPEGYISVCLYRDGARRYVRLHVLILEVFRGPRPPGMECCHGNGVRSDCRLDNLRWDTRSANHLDKRLHGTSRRRKANEILKLS